MEPYIRKQEGKEEECKLLLYTGCLKWQEHCSNLSLCVKKDPHPEKLEISVRHLQKTHMLMFYLAVK